MAPNGTLSMRRQCALLAVTRSSVYYEPVVPDAEELALMRRIDELHLQHPFFGSRMITQTLKAEGPVINRKRVQRLMRLMGLESTAPQPTTSTPAPDHPVYPYLLRGLTIARPNQVWATDITYIPMARGFAYLVAIIDWYSRRVLAWRLSNTLDTGFCIEALRDALAHFGRQQLLQPCVLGDQLLQAFRVRDGHPAELIPPQVVVRLREPVPPTQLLDRQARLGLPKEPDDLRLAESFLHVRSPFS